MKKLQTHSYYSDLELQPVEIVQPCTKCGTERKVLNGAHYRKRRAEAGITLTVMAQACGASLTLLSLMETGRSPFLPKYAEHYERVLKRYAASGDRS